MCIRDSNVSEPVSGRENSNNSKHNSDDVGCFKCIMGSKNEQWEPEEQHSRSVSKRTTENARKEGKQRPNKGVVNPYKDHSKVGHVNYLRAIINTDDNP